MYRTVLIKFGKGPLYNATYHISNSEPSGFAEQDFMSILYIF